MTYSIDYLLDIIESANIPYGQPRADTMMSWEPFKAIDGWIVHVRWRDDRFDYVDELVAPDGEVLDPYEWGLMTWMPSEAKVDEWRAQQRR